MSNTHTRDKAEAMPHAVPRTFVPKISGVHPYNTAYIAFGTDRQLLLTAYQPRRQQILTVALRLIPTVLARTSHGCSTIANIQQKSAVRKVLPARDRRRPNGDSISHAPSWKIIIRVNDLITTNVLVRETHDSPWTSSQRVYDHVP